LKGVRASPAVHWKMACTPVLDEAIHQSGVKVGVGNTILLQNTGVSRDTETKKRLPLVGCLNLLATHFLLLIGWLH